MTGTTASHASAASHGGPPPILVGVDEAPTATAALCWAARQAHLQQSRLRVVHTWEPEPGEVAVLTHEQHQRRRAAVVAARGEAIERELRRVAPDVRADVEILEGPAGPVLVELARHASLLVLATHDHPGRRRLTADSVGHYCLSYAPCPVVTVPGGPPAGDRG